MLIYVTAERIWGPPFNLPFHEHLGCIMQIRVFLVNFNSLLLLISLALIISSVNFQWCSMKGVQFYPRKTNGGYGCVRRMQGQFDP